jgi:hypothetical protein
MARRRCARCPRRTNQDRILCAHCVTDDRRAANGYRGAGRPRSIVKAADDLPAAEIDRRFAEAKQEIVSRGRRSLIRAWGSTAMEKQADSIIEHGKTCEKVPHVPDPRIPHERQGANEGWLHAGDDDGPYFVDGLRYCGRCHYWIG